MTTKCSTEKLNKFSFEHYTYINQIFGDESVREIISEVFPNPKYKFDKEYWINDIEESNHHFLREAETDDKICSFETGLQNMNKNKNDTLCQSYSLLTYFDIPIEVIQSEKQMQMIELYRKILDNKEFKEKFYSIYFEKGDPNYWKDMTKDKNPRLKITSRKDRQLLIQKIKSVLNKWEEYGYFYFIGNGKCPRVNKLTVQTPSIRRNSRLRTPSTVSIGGKNKTTRKNNT